MKTTIQKIINILPFRKVCICLYRQRNFQEWARISSICHVFIIFISFILCFQYSFINTGKYPTGVIISVIFSIILFTPIWLSLLVCSLGLAIENFRERKVLIFSWITLIFSWPLTIIAIITIGQEILEYVPIVAILPCVLSLGICCRYFTLWKYGIVILLLSIIQFAFLKFIIWSIHC